MNNYDWLISRLDAFVRKFYANQVLRGSLIFLTCLLFYVLTVSVGEYYLYMPVWLRLTIVSVFVVLGLASLIIWVAIPLAKMARLGRIISHEQAADIIGKHFPEISDKLLNILQLKKDTDTTSSRELLEASIDQRAKQISVVPFTAAVDLSKNKKLLPYLLPLVLVGVFILVAAPNVFHDASQRLLQPTKQFERPAPFSFDIKTLPLRVVRNADYTLVVETKGAALPADMSVMLGNEQVPMQVMEQHKFQYVFKNVTKSTVFRLQAAGFYSKEYELTVIQKPVLKAFKVQLHYPAYTGRKDEMRNSLGDMTLPVGTSVSWAFMADYTDVATIHFGTGGPLPVPGKADMFAYQYRFMNDTAYTFTLNNTKNNIADSYRYQVQVIPDQYPVLQVQQFKDTVSGKQIVLNGTAGDDYGVSRVLFHYDVTDGSGKAVANKAEALKITQGALTSFQHYFDIEALNLQPGQKLSYYIEAWDNDGVHGSKASRSEVMTYEMYGEKQVDSAINANSQQINSGLSNSSQKTQQLQSDYKDAESKMMESENMDWEQQQSLQQMQQKQLQVKSQLENVKKRFDEQMKQAEQKQYSEDVKDKQQDLQKQLDNLLNNELKEQMKKLQELMQKLNKDQALQAMQQMQEDNKLFKMDMERMQELMKKLETQMRMEDMANKLDDLAKKEGQLKNETEQNKKDNQSLNKEQEAIKKELEKTMQQDMKDLQEAAKKSKDPQANTDKEQQQGKQAQQQMQQSQDQLDNKQNSKASKSQGEAQQNMQDMANSMRDKAGGNDAEKIDKDIHAVRQILTNLIRLSFDQEDLMGKVQHTSPTAQAYVSNVEEQHRLHSNSKMIRDSLFEMSKDNFKLAATINKETTEIEKNMSTAVSALEDRRVADAQTRQQYVMTHANNLALMLNEALSNLMAMKAAQSKMPGSGSCSKPGGKKPKPGMGQQMSDIITQQQQLGNAMQQMQQSQGNKPGKAGEGKDGKDGKDGKNGKEGGKENGKQSGGENGNAEQLARLAQQQAAIRRQLQDLSSQLNSSGLGNSKELKELQQKMDKTETDLVNRRMSAELQLRQKEIESRLLEAQKAMREQEQDDKRSSKSAPDISRPVPPELQKYLTDRKQLLELYKTVPPQLKPYYRTMVENYYNMIGNK